MNLIKSMIEWLYVYCSACALCLKRCRGQLPSQLVIMELLCGWKLLGIKDYNKVKKNNAVRFHESMSLIIILRRPWFPIHC